MSERRREKIGKAPPVGTLRQRFRLDQQTPLAHSDRRASHAQVAKSEAISGGEDLTDAKGQSEAMAKAKCSLNAATADAVKANKGFRAVRVMPTLKDGHLIATSAS